MESPSVTASRETILAMALEDIDRLIREMRGAAGALELRREVDACALQLASWTTVKPSRDDVGDLFARVLALQVRVLDVRDRLPHP